MKRAPLRLVATATATVCITLAACSSALHPQKKPAAISENLHLPLAGGGEVQIIAVTYGTSHRLKPNATSHNSLARAITQTPHDYERSTTVPSVLIWWGWHPPGAPDFSLSPSGEATLLLPGGKVRQLEYPEPSGEIRSLAITQPPTSQPVLQIKLPVNGETIPLTIPNPAYSAPKP